MQNNWITIGDLIGNLSESSQKSTRTSYSLIQPKSFSLSVSAAPNGRFLIQSSARGEENYFEGFRKIYDSLDNDFPKLRHDLVAGLGNVSTDVPFSQIDPVYDENDSSTQEKWHKLTPDVWCPENRTIAELGTTMSLDEEPLSHDYDHKWVKYSSYTTAAKVNNYFVFIVSQNYVHTNYPMTQDMVTELCMRCRLGIAIETKCIELLGYNPFQNEDQNAKEKLTRAILSSINRSTLEDPDFNHWMVEYSLSPLTKDDVSHSINIVKKSFMSTKQSGITQKKKLDDYLSNFNQSNCREFRDKKRICNFPFIASNRHEDIYQNQINVPKIVEPDFNEFSTLPIGLNAIWTDCFRKECHVPLPVDEEIQIQQSEKFARDLGERHKHRRHHSFKPNLDYSEELDLAINGIGARDFGWDRKMKIDLDELNHRSFHPDAETDDIVEMLESDRLTARYRNSSNNIMMLDMLQKSKDLAQEKSPLINSIDIFSSCIYNSELICFSDLISCMVQEMALASKIFTPKGTFIYKYLTYYKVGMVIRNTGTHIFVSYIYDKKYSRIIDTGRLGPNIFETNNYYVSDWCSYDPSHLEHYIKCGPLMASVMSHYLALFKIDVTRPEEVDIFKNLNYKQFWYTLKFSLLTFLNNKLDLEELLTAQRYFTMNILDEVNPDPYRFVKRLPSVIRSRLTSFILKKTIDNMNYYSENKVSKTKVSEGMSGKRAEYHNLRSVACCGVLPIETCIELFYVGYLVSKERSLGVHSSFSICKKLVSEEIKFLKNKSEGKRVFVENLEKPADHQADIVFFKFMVHGFDKVMKRMIGPDHRSITLRDIINKMARTTFLDLATLKASARPYVEDIPLDIREEDVQFKTISEELKKKEPGLFKSRPKAILALSTLMLEYQKEKGKFPEHTIELVPYCLEKLESKDGYDSDLFSKSQHGGIREIHVLEIKARVVQYFVEIISRVICKYFKSETLTSPEQKEKFVPEHYKNFAISYPEFLTFCTSGDKKTWCQGHHAVRFANMLTGITDPLLHNFIYRALYLWVRKRVKLPADLIANFLANEKTPVTDEIFLEMRERFYKGEAPFLQKGGQTVRISSGMFQGLLHYASSVQHTMCQEVVTIILNDIWRNVTKTPIKTTIAQGSDDYAVLTSIVYDEKKYPTQVQFLNRLARTRAIITHYTGITDSDKTAQFILDVLEYNSEWSVARVITRPTLKWAIASMEISLVENFITRLRQFSNNLTQTLEGGASTFECSLIQLSQAWLHYKLLGLDSNYHYKSFHEKILEVPDPNAGYFPLEADLVCGLTGMDYTLYNLAKTTGYGSLLVNIEGLAEIDNLDYNGRKSKILGKEARTITVKFTSEKKWQRIVEESELPSYDECIDYFNKHPEKAFSVKSTWEEDRMAVALKLYSPGVRASLSGQQPILRMMVASAYMLNRPCFKYRPGYEEEQTQYKKFTLLQIIQMKKDRYFVQKGEPEILSALKSIFPMWEEYDHFKEFQVETNRSMFFERAEMRRRGKVQLEIFSAPQEEQFPILSLCMRKWFGKKHEVKVGSALFNELWGGALAKYGFLRDTIEETMIETDLNVIQLKFFLESITSKGRRVKLMDTAAKSSSTFSTITRIFWDSVKIRVHKQQAVMQSYLDLRSCIFSSLNFWYRDVYRTSLVRDLIKDSLILQLDSKELPAQSRGLKIIRDILNNDISRERAIAEISSYKSGAIGWFSVRQGFDKVSKSRIGPGEWRGRIGTISAIIVLDGHIITKLKLQSLNNMDQTIINLNGIMRDMRFKMPKDLLLSKDCLYFKPRGGIQRIENPEAGGIPIEIISDLHIDRFDEVDKTNWELETTPFSVRLVNIDPSGGKAILLSEKIVQSDWDKDSNWLLDEFTPLHYWHQAKSLPISEWRKLVRECKDLNFLHKPYMEHIRNLRKTSAVGVNDPLKMSNMFIRYWDGFASDLEKRSKLIDLDDRKDKLEEISIINPDEYNFLKELKDMDKPLSFEWGNEIMEDNSEEFGIEDFEDNSGALEAAETLKLYASSGEHISQELIDQLNVGMSLSNPFFSIFNNTLSSWYTNIALVNIYEEDLTFDDITGEVLTILTGKDKRTIDEEENLLMAQDSISQALSSITGVSMSSSVGRQREVVENLIESVITSKGFAQVYLRSILKKETERLRAMELAGSNDEIEESGWLEIDKRRVTIEFFDFLESTGDSPLSRDRISSDNDIYWAHIISLLYSHIGTMDELGDADETTVRGWQDSLRRISSSREYWSLLSDRFSLDIVMNMNGKTMFKEVYYGDFIGSERRELTYELDITQQNHGWSSKYYTPVDENI